VLLPATAIYAPAVFSARATALISNAVQEQHGTRALAPKPASVLVASEARDIASRAAAIAETRTKAVAAAIRATASDNTRLLGAKRNADAAWLDTKTKQWRSCCKA
jgi:hypothetical protein